MQPSLNLDQANSDQVSDSPKHPNDHNKLLLWCVLASALSPFFKLTKHFGSAAAALTASTSDWQALRIHNSHIARFAEYKKSGAPKVFLDTLKSIENRQFDVVYASDVHFPNVLKQLYDCPPLLFVRGDVNTLSQAQLAMVGTRKPSAAARDIAQNFANTLAQAGFWVTSGLAEGIDACAHLGALALSKRTQQPVRTIAVLGNGISQCYPPKNQGIYDAILHQGGAIVSEFLPTAKPAAHHFPRRNRLVSGLSLATLVVEAAQKSGSLITANLAAEQGKLVFAIPGHIYNAQAKGCHELIRQGAILVDSPEQIIEDVNLPKRLHDDAGGVPPDSPQPDNLHLGESQTQNRQTAASQSSSQMPKQAPDQIPKQAPDQMVSPDLPAHLQQLLSSLDWVGQDMDKLINTTGLDAATLSSQLMELELMGYSVQQGGLYLRCRQA